MEEQTAVIFTGGIYDEHPDAPNFYLTLVESSSLFVCADSGANYAKKINKKPRFIIGDMDSVDKESLVFFKDVEQIKYRCDKDYTDTEIAIGKVQDEGFKKIIICGGIGNRFDHSIANALSLLRLKKEGIDGFIMNYFEQIFIASSSCKIRDKEGWTVSFIPLSPKVTKVSIIGCKYSLTSHTLEMGVSLTVSNIITSSIATITFEEGDLMVVLTRPNGLE